MGRHRMMTPARLMQRHCGAIDTSIPERPQAGPSQAPNRRRDAIGPKTLGYARNVPGASLHTGGTPQLITVAEAAELLSVNHATIRGWIERDQIPYIQLRGADRASYRIPLNGLLSVLSGSPDLVDELRHTAAADVGEAAERRREARQPGRLRRPRCGCSLSTRHCSSRPSSARPAVLANFSSSSPTVATRTSLGSTAAASGSRGRLGSRTGGPSYDELVATAEDRVALMEQRLPDGGPDDLGLVVWPRMLDELDRIEGGLRDDVPSLQRGSLRRLVLIHAAIVLDRFDLASSRWELMQSRRRERHAPGVRAHLLDAAERAEAREVITDDPALTVEAEEIAHYENFVTGRSVDAMRLDLFAERVSPAGDSNSTRSTDRRCSTCCVSHVHAAGSPMAAVSIPEDEVTWTECAMPDCQGAVAHNGLCLRHLHHADEGAFARIVSGEDAIDGRGVVFTRALIEALIAMARRDGDLAVLPAVSFDWSRFPSGTSFIGVAFDGDAVFVGAAFAGDTWITQAVFRGTASFRRASFWSTSFETVEFRRGFLFDEAKVEQRLAFVGTTFGGLASFRRSQLSGVSVSGVECRRDAIFDGAILGEAQLGPLLARGTFSLDDATLTGPAVLDARARVLRCERTRFQGIAIIEARWAEVVLDHASFEKPSVITTAEPVPELDETALTRRCWADDASDEFQRTERARVVSMRRANVEHLTLAKVDLRACRFFGAHNLHALSVESADSFALAPPRFGRTRRRAIAEEHEFRARAAGSNPKGWFAGPTWGSAHAGKADRPSALQIANGGPRPSGGALAARRAGQPIRFANERRPSPPCRTCCSASAAVPR
jgi:excisionase family DNA binding protein